MATSVPATSVPAKLGKARSLCFTLNNYNDDHLQRLRTIAPDAKYLVYGFEVAPTTGMRHLQGFIAWDNPRSIDRFKDAISQTLHIERSRGTPQQASDYCKKDGKYEEFGELPRQGKRTDWCVAVEEIKSGVPVEEVVENQPQLLPCIRALDTYRSRLLKPLNREIEVVVLWGDAGTGKSRWAYDTYPELYSKPPSKWWDGYQGQETILLDDYYGYIPYTELLNVLDRYPYHAEIKGGYVWAQWKRVIITSNKPPEKWYNFGMTPALARRLHKIFFYTIDAPPQIYDLSSCLIEGQG